MKYSNKKNWFTFIETDIFYEKKNNETFSLENSKMGRYFSLMYNNYYNNLYNSCYNNFGYNNFGYNNNL